MTVTNLRHNPRLSQFEPVPIVGEIKTCKELLPELPGVFGFYLNEVPLKESPSSVTIERVSDSTPFTEISGGSLGSLQFYVDYNNPQFSGRGLVELPSSEDGNDFECGYQGLGTTANEENLRTIFTGGASLETDLSGLQTRDLSWNNTTINLNAGVYQVRDLTISGNVLLRSTDTNSSAILEVLGNCVFSPGATLEAYKVFLIFRKPVTGDATTPGIIKSPNGAAGGAGGSGVYSGGGGGGGGAGGGGGGGGAGGGIIPASGGAGGAASLGGAGGIPSDLSGSFGSSGSNAITELGGGLAGSNGSNGATGGAGGAGGNGSIGAGGGGGGFGIGASGGGGNGGAASEQLWVSAGGNGGAGGDSGGTNSGGGGGGGGGVWIKALFLSSVSNLIIRTGKGGVGGNAVDDTRRGAGGQSGSVRIYLRKDLVTNLAVDVSVGTSSGNTKRDGTAGAMNIHDIDSGEKTTVWPASWGTTEDRRTNIKGFLNESGYYSKSSPNAI